MRKNSFAVALKDGRTVRAYISKRRIIAGRVWALGSRARGLPILTVRQRPDGAYPTWEEADVLEPTAVTANDYRHIFATVLPPSVEDNPICGAVLDREWTGSGKPNCPACEEKRTELLRLAGSDLRRAILELSKVRA